MMADDVHVMHGYYMSDLHRMAQAGVTAAAAVQADAHERHQTAWDGVVDALLDATDRPSAGLLVRAARHAVERAWGVERHHHGIASAGGLAPRHVIYWQALGAPSPSPERQVVERLALAQIWTTLGDSEREALTALAVMNSQRGAADMLGVHYMTVGKWVRRGRVSFLALWHEGETPSTLWRRDRRERTHDLAYTMARSGTIRRTGRRAAA